MSMKSYEVKKNEGTGQWQIVEDRRWVFATVMWEDEAHRVCLALNRRKELRAEVERLRSTLDARLCDKHQDSKGLYGYESGEATTPSGGGCVVCIGNRVDSENAMLRQAMEKARGKIHEQLCSEHFDEESARAMEIAYNVLTAALNPPQPHGGRKE